MQLRSQHSADPNTVYTLKWTKPFDWHTPLGRTSYCKRRLDKQVKQDTLLIDWLTQGLSLLPIYFRLCFTHNAMDCRQHPAFCSLEKDKVPPNCGGKVSAHLRYLWCTCCTALQWCFSKMTSLATYPKDRHTRTKRNIDFSHPIFS